jgi:hypothetical protein
MPSVKEIYSRISDVTIDADSINLNTDTVESLLSTVQADIALVKTDIANGVLSDVRDGTGNAITSTVSGAKRSLDVAPINQSLTTGTGTASGSSTSGTDLLASTDVSGFAEASVQFTNFATGAPVIQPQVSNDNSTWVNTTVQNVQGITTTSANSIGAAGIFKVALLGSRYFRLRVATNGTGGTYDFTYTLNPRTTFPNTQSVVFAATPSVTSTLVAGSAAGASVGVYSNYLTISSAGTNATNIRTSQCVLYMCNVTNLTSSFKYLKLFNTASAITVGTSTPTLTIPIPPNSTIPFDCGGVGIRFTNGLAFSITGGLATSDTTAVLAGDVVVNIAYV